MSWSRLNHAILSLYPAAWRDRYGRETAALIDDILAGDHPKRVRLAIDLLRGAFRERTRPTIRRSDPRLVVGRYLWRHRDCLARTSLDQQAMRLFEPGEQVLGTFDAATGHPQLGTLGIVMPWIAFLNLIIFVVPLQVGGSGHVSSYDRSFLVINVLGIGVLGLAVLAFCRATGTRTFMFAVTTKGLVQCRLDALHRPRIILGRSSAVAPQLLRRGVKWRKVALGDRVYWIPKTNDSVMSWMAYAVR